MIKQKPCDNCGESFEPSYDQQTICNRCLASWEDELNEEEEWVEYNGAPNEFVYREDDV